MIYIAKTVSHNYGLKYEFLKWMFSSRTVHSSFNRQQNNMFLASTLEISPAGKHGQYHEGASFPIPLSYRSML